MENSKRREIWRSKIKKRLSLFSAYHCIIYSRHHGRSKFKRVEENLRQRRCQKDVSQQPSQNKTELSKPDFAEKAQEKPKGESKFLPFNPTGGVQNTTWMVVQLQ